MVHLRSILKSFFILGFASLFVVACGDDSEENNGGEVKVNYTLSVGDKTVQMTQNGSAVEGTIEGLSQNSLALKVTGAEKVYSFEGQEDIMTALRETTIGASVNSSLTAVEATEAGVLTLLKDSYVEYDWKAPTVNVTVSFDASAMTFKVATAVVEAMVASPIDPENLECTDVNYETMYIFGTGIGWQMDETVRMTRGTGDDQWKYTFKHETSRWKEEIKIVSSSCWSGGEWALEKSEGPHKVFTAGELAEGAVVTAEFDLVYKRIGHRDGMDEDGCKPDEEGEIIVCGPEEVSPALIYMIDDREKYNDPVYTAEYVFDAQARKLLCKYTIVTAPTAK